MRWVGLAAASMAVLALAPGVARGQATQTEIVPDPSLGTVVEASGSTFTVTGGTAVGPNLFHSFEIFDLAARDTVRVQTGAGIANVIIRVTGGAPSTVEKPIPPIFAEPPVGRPDVFFFNPAGGEFDFRAEPPHPRQGVFYTSAQRMVFADGAIFSAESGPQALTGATPAAFEFLGGARADVSGGTIVFEGGNVSLVDEHVNTSRNIEVDARSLTLDGSGLEVTTRAGLEGDPGDPFRIDVAGRVDVINGSVLSAYSGKSPRPIEIRAQELSIAGSKIEGFSDFCSLERGGDILALEARSVRLSEGASVSWSCGTGNVENPLRIVASHSVLLQGGSIVRTHSTDIPPPPIVIEDQRGRHGTLRVALSDGSAMESSYRNAIFGSGAPGIRVLARSLRLDGSRFTTGEDAGSAAQTIVLDLAQLFLRHGASLSARGGF